MNDADRRIIGAGNAWAHGGDAVIDARLYEGTGGRRGFITFENLYGMSAGDVWIISKYFAILKETLRLTRSGHQPTIDVLNTHAGITASNHKFGSD